VDYSSVALIRRTPDDELSSLAILKNRVYRCYRRADRHKSLWKITNGVDSHPTAVFGAEHAHGASRARLIKAHFFANDRKVFFDLFVDHILNLFYLFGGHFFRMGEIETQALGGNIGAPLQNMIAQNAAQRRQKQMRRRVQFGRGNAIISQPALKHPRAGSARKFLMLF